MNRITASRLTTLESRSPPPCPDWLLPLGACLALTRRALLGDHPPGEEPFTLDRLLRGFEDLAALLGLDREAHDIRDLLDRAVAALQAGPEGPFHRRALWDIAELRRRHPEEFGR